MQPDMACSSSRYACNAAICTVAWRCLAARRASVGCMYGEPNVMECEYHTHVCKYSHM